MARRAALHRVAQGNAAERAVAEHRVGEVAVQDRAPSVLVGRAQELAPEALFSAVAGTRPEREQTPKRRPREQAAPLLEPLLAPRWLPGNQPARGARRAPHCSRIQG
jgi:hypothetical protein